jgi:hypothetical protein
VIARRATKYDVEILRALQLRQVPQTIRPDETRSNRDTHSEARCSRLSTLRRTGKKQGRSRHTSICTGFWDEHCFLTKTGDLGAVLSIGGIDYESLDHAGRDYAVKRLEAAFRSLDDKCRLYQILFKHNRPEIPHAEYDSPLVRAAVEQRSAFLESKADRLYSIEMYWVVMIDGRYAKTDYSMRCPSFSKTPGAASLELKTLFAGKQQRTLLYEQIERDRLLLQQKINSLSGQLNDLMKVELLRGGRDIPACRRLVNFRPSKIQDAPLCGARHLDWQVCDSELEAHRGYLQMDDDYVRVLTLKELPGETRPFDPQWPARHPGKLPCRHRMASRR